MDMRLDSVRGYTLKERKAKYELITENIKQHQEELANSKLVQTLYPNPKHYTFQEILEGKDQLDADEEGDGFILDLGK